MKNRPAQILIVSGDKKDHTIINCLKRIADPDFVQFTHAGGSNSDIEITSLLRMSGRHSPSKYLKNGDYFSGEAIQLVDEKMSSRMMMQGIDQLHRGSRDLIVGKKSHKFAELSLHDSQNYYRISTDTLGSILVENKIDSVLFLNIPHLFYDTLLYQVAKAKGIETLVITQSLFPNFYYSLHSVDDCGILPPLSPKKIIEPMTNEWREASDWYYMQNIKQERGELGTLGVRGIFHLFVFLLTTNPSKLWRPAYILRLLKSMRKISSTFPEWRDPFAKFFHVKQLTYFENLIEFERAEINLDRKFVYFPLQLQPEMTTSSLGSRYSDQILAIEQLAKIIPTDCLIYVKENPKQTGKMRGPMFFHRLRRISSVRMLPSHANTHALTNHAVFVATVTGTVGWEAIQKGKKVLVFGKAWYRCMPGVIEYHKEIQFEEICKLTFNHSELEQYVEWLTSRAHVGVIDPKFASIVENFEPEKNAQIIAETLLDLLFGQIPTTFQTFREN